VRQLLVQLDLRLVGAAVLILGAAVGVIWRVGHRRRGAELGRPAAGEAPRARSSVPTPVIDALHERGLDTPAHLANMTELERHVLFSTMARTIDQEARRKNAVPLTSALPFIRPDELPTLYCPTCSDRIERFSSTPPLTSRCDTCGAVVIVRRDAGRIMLTVVPRDIASTRRPEGEQEP